MIEEKIKKLKRILLHSNSIVFFGGAGVSTESGIPDFRSVDGLYHTKYKYSPEEIISHDYFINHTKEFYQFYKEKLVYPNKEPNITHLKLSEFEKEGKLKAVITQNIDGLHQKAGSKKVLELHGSIWRNYCMNCHKFYSLDAILQEKDIPICECKGKIKPDVVLYQESLDSALLDDSIKFISNADTLIVAGTSLVVYPAAGLIRYFKGNHLVLINKTATSYDSDADLLIQESLGEVFSKL